jgi:membrane-associated phospholipid phosphatase
MNEGVISILSADNINFFSLYGIYRWGIDLIKGIQVIENPLLTVFMKGLTFLGTEYVYILITLLVLWCVNEKKGLHLGVLILLSAWANSLLKFVLKQPRPYNLDPSVGLAFESSYGIPSGHAQMSLVFWGLIACWYQGRGKGAVRLAAVLFTLMLGFTRLYLGVHFPTDLLAGWLLGGIILVLYFILEKPVATVLSGEFSGAAFGEIRPRMISAALIALLMNALHPQDTSLSGLFLGFAVGYNLMQKYAPFSAGTKTGGEKPGTAYQVLRYLLGLTGAALVYLGLRAILPGESSLWAEFPLWGFASPYYQLGRFLRYGLLGLWAALGAPWIFTQIDQKIASRSSV